MIRRVELQDAKAITTIYNEYVRHSVATFETEPLREEDMRNRIAGIAVRFPYFVYEEEGKVVGLLLCPFVEGEGCLQAYVGNNGLFSSRIRGEGHRQGVDGKID